MDFPAVVEAAIGGRWYVFDATGLAPRRSPCRIATEHDADTAFLSAVSWTFRQQRPGDRGPSLPEDDGSELIASA